MNPALTVAIIGGFIVLTLYFAELQAEAPIALPPEFEARLIMIDREAVEKAYAAHVQNLFLSWMKDSSGQPERASRGMNQARRAYVASMQALQERVKKQESR